MKRVVGENQDVTVAIPLALIARIWDWHASTGLLWPSWKGKSVTAWSTSTAKSDRRREKFEPRREDDEELYEAALAASHRPGGDPLAGLLRDM